MTFDAFTLKLVAEEENPWSDRVSFYDLQFYGYTVGTIRVSGRARVSFVRAFFAPIRDEYPQIPTTPL